MPAESWMPTPYVEAGEVELGTPGFQLTVLFEPLDHVAEVVGLVTVGAVEYMVPDAV